MPTGSFKDRGASVMLSLLREQGIAHVLEDSSGNGGAAVSAYAAAILKSWRGGGTIAGLLIGLYAVLYILLSLEAYSLLIGSVLLFAALAAVMYFTRNVDWRAVSARPDPA